MGLFSFVKAGKKVFDTVKSVTPNVGNLKKNQETIKKLTDTTDKYVKKANEKGFTDLAKDLRKSGSKSLQKTDKILRKNKMNGGRIGRKLGGGTKGGGMSDTQVKKKYKNLGNLPESIQIKIAGKKIAKKV